MDRLKIVEILASEGFRPELDSENDIAFKYEGANCLVMFDDDDELYLRFVLPNFWPIENEKEREEAIRASVFTTKLIKAAKIFPVKDQMWSAVEVFLPSEEALRPVLDKILVVLAGAVSAFSEEMRKQLIAKSEA
jgi:hypothetical protein